MGSFRSYRHMSAIDPIVSSTWDRLRQRDTQTGYGMGKSHSLTHDKVR